MRSLLSSNSIPIIFLFMILALGIMLLLTFFLEKAKKKTGHNLLFILIGGIFIGIVGIRASAINNPFYLYMIIMIWNLIAGIIHVYFSARFLDWTKTEAIGWRLLFALAIVFTGFASMFMFMNLVKYEFMLAYNLSAILMFLAPLLFMHAIDQYFLIPAKVFIVQKPWVYNKSTDLQFRFDEISHFFLIKYKLSTHLGGEVIESLAMRAPGNIKFGDYFNATLEVSKVTQNRYSIETKDSSNKHVGWFFFLADGSTTGKLLDPNKTFLELGLSNPVYFGNSSKEEIENITQQAEREGKTYQIICKREQEYKSSLLEP